MTTLTYTGEEPTLVRKERYGAKVEVKKGDKIEVDDYCLRVLQTGANKHVFDAGVKPEPTVLEQKIKSSEPAVEQKTEKKAKK